MSECYCLTGYARFKTGETRVITLDYLCFLENTDTVIDSVTVTEANGDSDLTIASAAVNSVALKDKYGTTIGIGQAIQFKVSTSVTDQSSTFVVKVESTTDVNSEVLIDYIQVEFKYGQ